MIILIATIRTPLLQIRQLPQIMTRAFIPARIPIQIQLMIRLGIPPLARRQNLRDDLAMPPLLVGLLRHVLCDTLLLVVVVEDAGAVLGADVRALAVGRGRVVHLVEVFDQGAVGDLLRVED